MTIEGQSETEVKGFLDKMGTEYRYGCFSEKKPDGNLNIFKFNK